MFKRYFQHSDYHSLPVSIRDLKSSASRNCQFCVVAFDVFRWLSRTKGDGPQAILQAKVEICVPFESGHPLVLTYSWLPSSSSPAREYDLQLAVPQKCSSLPWSTLTVGQQIPKHPKSSGFRAASWLRNCLEHHGNQACEMGLDQLPKTMPKRLVYVGDAHSKLRLVVCDDIHVPYTALSYCWGPKQHVLTTRTTLAQQLADIAWTTLPKTYRDAIEFTRMLGYRYIWIDSLCIIQDDKDDWNHEASCMGQIYRDAILVVSATNANHVNFGCFTERSGSRSFRNRLKLKPEDPSHVLVQEPNTHFNLITSPRPQEEWPVFRRAWTLQERLLATRIVHFTAGELVWECATSSSCECGHMDSTNAMTARMRYDVSIVDSMTEDKRANLWDELALAYQNRLLTEDTDRLSALSGLAQRFQSDGLGTYTAGLWSNYALSMMLWEVKSGRKSAKYVAPSWSWASVQGRLQRNDPIETNDKFIATIDSSECILDSDDSYGAIQRAYICITSPTAEGVISLSDRHGHAMVGFKNGIKAFLVSDLVVSDSQIGSKVKCAFLRGMKEGPSGRYIEALVLRISKTMGEYERLGIAHIKRNSSGHHERFKDDILSLTTEQLKII